MEDDQRTYVPLYPENPDLASGRQDSPDQSVY